jgi:hypothetical protein
LKSKKPTPVTVAVPRSGVKVADLYDRAALVALLRDADAAIHTASPGDETSANLDAAVADAASEAFAGTGKSYLHISGVWSTAATPRSRKRHPSTRPGSSPGKNRSNAESSKPSACAVSSSSRASSTATAEEHCPGSCSAHRESAAATSSWSAQDDSTGRPSTSRTSRTSSSRA